MTDAEADAAIDPGLGVVELSIIMPCLDEAKTVGKCVSKAIAYLRGHDIDGEILVADNGSTDGSQAIAAARGRASCRLLQGDMETRCVPASRPPVGRSSSWGIPTTA